LNSDLKFGFFFVTLLFYKTCLDKQVLRTVYNPTAGIVSILNTFSLLVRQECLQTIQENLEVFISGIAVVDIYHALREKNMAIFASMEDLIF